MDRDALRASITALARRRELLQREMDDVDLELATQNARYALLVNEDASVYRLPNEILTDIFLICHRSALQNKRSFPFQVTASHVSHRWRTVVHSTPLLWNTIDLRVDDDKYAQGRILSKFDAHLLHSGACFLDITLDFALPVGLCLYLDRLSVHAARLRRLSLATNDDLVQDIHSLLLMADTPALEHLSLNLGRPMAGSAPLSPRRPYVDVSPTILKCGARPLSFVRLAGLALGRLHPPLQSVTTLHLEGWTRHYMTHEQLTDILQGAPVLVNLSLNQLVIHHPRDPLEVVQRVALPHLRSLRIRGPCSPIARFLALIDATQLHSLSLYNIDTFHSEVMPSVQSLTVDSSHMDELEIRNLFRALPSISHLDIDELPDIFSMLLPDNGVMKPWPKLQTLSLRNLGTIDVANFCNMVFSLKESSNALSEVYLDRRSRTALRTKHRLDWLHDRVNVEHCDSPDPWPIGLGYDDPHDLVE